MENTNNISISKNAAEKIKNIISSQEKGLILKISVLGGGCAGFSYQFDLVKELDKGDLLLEENGAKVLILGITFKEDCPDMRNTKPTIRPIEGS